MSKSIREPQMSPIKWDKVISEFTGKPVRKLSGFPSARGNWSGTVDGLRFQVSVAWGGNAFSQSGWSVRVSSENRQDIAASGSVGGKSRALRQVRSTVDRHFGYPRGEVK